MADGVLRGLGQGFASFATGTPLSEVQQQGQVKDILGQLRESGSMDPTDPLLAQLATVDPAKSAQISQVFGGIDDRRQAALFSDARKGKFLLENGNTEGALALLQDRIQSAQQLNGDPSDSVEIAEDILAGDIDGALEKLSLVERLGIDSGFLKAPSAADRSKFIGTPERVQRNGQTFLSGIVQRPDGSFGREDVPLSGELVSALGETGDEESNRKIRQAVGTTAGNQAIRLRTEPTIAAEVETAKGEAKLPIQIRKETQTANVARIRELRGDSRNREANTKKAKQFLNAFQNKGAESGASRSGLGFIPGVFTDQAEFDEKFNAFAEVAARSALKASGEIRPTDADVQGMKKAMFGVGRDEGTNIQLLEEYIIGQNDQDAELDELKAAAKRGNIDTFTFGVNEDGAQQPQQLTPEQRQARIAELRAKQAGQ